MSTGHSLLGLVAFVALCLGVGVLGSIFTMPSVGTWYAGLKKPEWTPPPALFGPVWTVLYILMGVSAWLVWRDLGSVAAASGQLAIFGLQLALNLLWSFLFFGLRTPLLALVDIAALWIAIVATIVAFWRVSPLAGALLLPYLAWVTFAAALNFAIVRMNPAGASGGAR